MCGGKKDGSSEWCVREGSLKWRRKVHVCIPVSPCATHMTSNQCIQLLCFLICKIGIVVVSSHKVVGSFL